MRKSSIYLDTTVPSAYFDERVIDRQQYTKEFWSDILPKFKAYISDVVLIEIQDTPDIQRRLILEESIKSFEVLDLEREAIDLAIEYIKQGIFSAKSIYDACHVAIAVINGISYLISWNYRHLLKLKTRREVNVINLRHGYGFIEIVAPAEL